MHKRSQIHISFVGLVQPFFLSKELFRWGSILTISFFSFSSKFQTRKFFKFGIVEPIFKRLGILKLEYETSSLHNRRIEAVKIAVIEISWKPVFQFFSKNGFLIVKIFLLITEIELIWLFQRIGHNELMIWEILRKVVLTLPSMLFFALKFDSSLAK